MSTIRERLTYENILYALLFLFPLFAVTVRHWVSGIFTLMFFLSVSYYFHRYRRDPVNLSTQEKRLLYFLLFYFIFFVLSSLINNL